MRSCRDSHHSALSSSGQGASPRCSSHRRELDRERTRPVVLVEIDPLVDRVWLVLPGAEGHRRNAVANHPVCIQPAIRGADGRCCADAGHRRDRTFDHGQALLHAERIIVGLSLELDAARLAITVLDALGRLLERRLVGLGNLLEELAVVAAAFAAHVHIVGNDIGGVPGRPALTAGDGADIAGALPLALYYLATPATGL